MKQILPRIFLCASFLVLLSAGTNSDKMDSFKWLVGTWSMKTSEGTIMETWLPMSDTMFSGQSTMRKKTTEVVPLESVRLVCRNKEYYYIPTVKGQNNNAPVEFKITSVTKNSFTAENENHDFPKRIRYTLFKKDSLHAVIDGGKSVPGKKQDFYYQRVKKAPAPAPVKKKN
jgi:hypothetical protein